MKQNNKKNTWKAIVAVMLVMATLFSISTMVSANFVEEIFEEVCDMMTVSSSISKADCPATSSIKWCPNTGCHKQIECVWSGCLCGHHVTKPYRCDCPIM